MLQKAQLPGTSLSFLKDFGGGRPPQKHPRTSSPPLPVLKAPILLLAKSAPSLVLAHVRTCTPHGSYTALLSLSLFSTNPWCQMYCERAKHSGFPLFLPTFTTVRLHYDFQNSSKNLFTLSICLKIWKKFTLIFTCKKSYDEKIQSHNNSSFLQLWFTL